MTSEENNTSELIDIIEYEGIYKINPNNGDIWSCYKKRFLRPNINSHGYKYLNLSSKEHKRKNKQVHRLVYMSVNKLNDSQLVGYVVDHRNNDKLDNSIGNLRLATHSQNSMNSDKINSNTGVKGITQKKNGSYQCEIMSNRNRYTLTTKDFELAKRWTLLVRKDQHKEFANDGTPSNNISE